MKENNKITPGFYCNGSWSEPFLRDKSFTNINPADGQIIARVRDCSRDDAKRAIACAAEAQESWEKRTPKERGEFLVKIAREMKNNSEYLAKIITAESGKPLRESVAEIAYAADFFVWYAEEGKRAYGEIVPANAKDKMRLVMRSPAGVAGIISPWNFPQAMLTRKLAPALAAGCSVVVKPAEQTPCSAVELFKIIDSTGLPPGTANLVCTSEPAATGEEFCSNKEIAVISFTGSAQVGKIIIRESAENVTKLSLEHGGNAAFVVFADADIDLAVKGLMASKFRNAGQTCICANRIFVDKEIADEFTKKVQTAVSRLKVGNGIDPLTDIGPLIDREGFEKVENQVKDAINKKAKCLCGGKRIYPDKSENAFFYEPCLLTDVDDSMLVFRQETFGPIVPVALFDNTEDIIKAVNNTDYGLSAYAYTKSLSTGFNFARNVKAGIIGINDPVPSVPECPFGGLKQSGIGREGGWRGLDEFLETKYVSVGL